MLGRDLMSDVLIGSRLRAARVRARFSTEEVARFARVTKAKVCGWEAGKSALNAQETTRVAWVLKMTPARLFGGAHLRSVGLTEAAATALLASWPPSPSARSTRPLKGVAERPPLRAWIVRCARCRRPIALTAVACEGCARRRATAASVGHRYPVFRHVPGCE